MGLVKDGYNSVVRYYYNNFNDGYRQVNYRITFSGCLKLLAEESSSYTAGHHEFINMLYNL